MSNEGLPVEHFTVHDLHRTGSTLLNDLGFNRDWVEKCLAHEEGHSSRGFYNKAEYDQQRRLMLQEWGISSMPGLKAESARQRCIRLRRS